MENIVNSLGNILDSMENIVESIGNIVDSMENIVGSMENIVDSMGNILDSMENIALLQIKHDINCSCSFAAASCPRTMCKNMFASSNKTRVPSSTC